MPRFIHGRPVREGRVGVLLSAFNPPTRAHLALAAGAADRAGLGQVVLTLPETLPHKSFEGAPCEERVEMLRLAAAESPRLAAAVCGGSGLFIDAAREFRGALGDAVELYLICGRDAAERIVGWDYGAGPSIAEQLREFTLLVGSRGGAYRPPPELSGAVQTFDLDSAFERISSSAVREAIAAGRPWRETLPRGVAERIARGGLYGA